MQRSATVFVPGRVLSMNDVIKLRASWKGAWARAKREYAEVAVPLLRDLGKFGRADVFLHVCEPNTRRDPDNVCSGASKCILDCLQEAGVLEDDGWKSVASLNYAWSCAPDEPGVFVMLTEAEDLSGRGVG